MEMGGFLTCQINICRKSINTAWHHEIRLKELEGPWASTASKYDCSGYSTGCSTPQQTQWRRRHCPGEASYLSAVLSVCSPTASSLLQVQQEDERCWHHLGLVRNADLPFNGSPGEFLRGLKTPVPPPKWMEYSWWTPFLLHLPNTVTEQFPYSSFSQITRSLLFLTNPIARLIFIFC